MGFWLFGRKADGGLDKARADVIEQRLNQVETRLERVENDNVERQLSVLTASEKVLHQLRARERKRDKDAEDTNRGGEVDGMGDRDSAGDYPGHPSRELARRFRRF